MPEFTLRTGKKEELVDITSEVEVIVSESKTKEGICLVYVPHATAAIIINENADPNLCDDILKALNHIVPDLGYKHDRIDKNAIAHIKSAILGPSETIPVKNGQLQLGTWQGIALAEFDGPRQRRVIVEVSS